MNIYPRIAAGHRASLTPPPTAVTARHTVALSPPCGALCVLPKSVLLLLLTSLYKIYTLRFQANPHPNPLIRPTDRVYMRDVTAVSPLALLL